MIRRTSCSSQSLHLFNQERNQCSRIQDGFCFLIQVSLVSRTTTLCYAKEFILHTLSSFDVNLSRQVAASIHFFVHSKRSVLRVTKIFFCISLVHTQRKRFFITVASPNLLSFFTVDNCCTGILTERKYAFGSYFCITQESQSYILVVVACFRVSQNLCHLFVVRAAQHERNIAESRIGHRSQTFFFDFQDGFSFKLAYRHIVFCKQIVFSCILAMFKHWLILEFGCCHNTLN